MDGTNQIPIPIPKNKRLLIAETDIIELHNKKEGTATEEDFKNVLRRYNLRDGLIALGRMSNILFNSREDGPYIDATTGVFVTQFALAYLANILLISSANDYKSKYISQKDNLLTLCNSYSNSLIDRLTENDKPINQDDFCSFMIRLDSEQIEYQFSPIYMMARTIIIFNELIQNTQSDKFEPLDDIFEKKTTLSIYEYFRLCFAIFAASSQKTATFSINTFTNSNIPQLKDLLTEEKIIKILNILKANYKEFREEDMLENDNLNPIFTKTRFNPLLVYPVIETDAKHLGDPYVVPNVFTLIKRSFGGLYWWFDRYFENQGQQQDFRNYFGRIFQEYVGRILKNIYGEKNVHEEIVYGKNLRFIDWWIERDNKIYLFESKAYQFTLPSKQTGDKETVINEIKKKVVEAIVQVYKRIQDIQKYEELKSFKKKQIIPFIVFMDIPFVSSYLYELWIKETLGEIEQEKQISGLKDFQIFLIDIEELELYDECTNIIELEDIFQKFKGNIGEGFLSILRKEKGNRLRNRYLDIIYRNFCEGGFGITINSK